MGSGGAGADGSAAGAKTRGAISPSPSGDNVSPLPSPGPPPTGGVSGTRGPIEGFDGRIGLNGTPGSNGSVEFGADRGVKGTTPLGGGVKD
jgi:hypothetical protein